MVLYMDDFNCLKIGTKSMNNEKRYGKWMKVVQSLVSLLLKNSINYC